MLGDEGGAAPVHDDDERRPWEFDDDERRRRGCVGTDGRRARDQGRARNSSDPRAAASGGPHSGTRGEPRADGPLTGRCGATGVGSRDMPVAIITGVGLGAARARRLRRLDGAHRRARRPSWSTIAAGEAYSGMRLAGHRPAAALGLVACLVAHGRLVQQGHRRAAARGGAVLRLHVPVVPRRRRARRRHRRRRHHDARRSSGSASSARSPGCCSRRRSSPTSHGVHFLLGAIIVTVANDVGALVFGKLFGRHPMAPPISPNKTWEGAIGAAVVTVIAGACVSLLPDWTVSSGLTLGIARRGPRAARRPVRVDVQAQPRAEGHGAHRCPATAGFLDRVDGLLSCCPRRTTWSSRSTWADAGRERPTVASDARDPRRDRVDRDPGARRRSRRTPTPSSSTPERVDATSTSCVRARPRAPAARVVVGPTPRPPRRSSGPSLPTAPRCSSATRGSRRPRRRRDVVLNAVVGFAGVPATLAALRAGRRLALANKESLIVAAPLVERGPRDRRAPSSCPSTRSTARSTSASRASQGPTRCGRCAASSSPRRADRSAAVAPDELADVTRRRRARAPDVADGREDHDRLARRS